MRFKTNENLPKEIADLLALSGHDALRVDEQGLGGVADSRIATACQVELRAIITLDTDFLDVRCFPPENHAGIIVPPSPSADNFSFDEDDCSISFAARLGTLGWKIMDCG